LRTERNLRGPADVQAIENVELRLWAARVGGGSNKKDVKNAGRSDYVLEKT
jgi:hypothetical protein